MFVFPEHAAVLRSTRFEVDFVGLGIRGTSSYTGTCLICVSWHGKPAGRGWSVEADDGTEPECLADRVFRSDPPVRDYPERHAENVRLESIRRKCLRAGHFVGRFRQRFQSARRKCSHHKSLAAARLSIEESSMAKKRVVTTTINGNTTEFLCEPRQTLLEVLRDVLDLTGTKEGCSNGNCGACTILMNGRPVDSCLVLAMEAEGAALETIEGVATADGLDAVQQAFLENAALQCGICTPGFIMQARALLNENPNPSEQEIRFYLAGNLCRCTGYDKIVRAVQDAAQARQEVNV